MADVKIVDIDSEQWNMKDQNARDRLNTIEDLIPQGASSNNKLVSQSVLQNYFAKTDAISYLRTTVKKNEWTNIPQGVYLVETDIHYTDAPMHLYLIGKYAGGCNVWDICGSNALTLSFGANGIILNVAQTSEAFLNVIRVGDYG